MRFQPSQTTPSFLDRRIQLRMLSFVGLLSVIMVTLSVINSGRSPSRDAGLLRQADDSAAALSFEVLDDPAPLASDEVYVVANAADDGIRGQWAPSSTDDDAEGDDHSNPDRGLFKPRRIEREEEHDVFVRRSKSLPRRAPVSPPRENPLNDDLPRSNRTPFDDDGLEDLKGRTIERPPAKPSDWEPTPATPSRDEPSTREDDRTGLWDLLTKKRADDADKESNLPDQPFDEPITTRQPTQPPRKETPASLPETIPARTPNHRPAQPAVDDFPKSNPLRQPSRNEIPARNENPVEKLELNDDFTIDEAPRSRGKDRSDPIDLRNRDDLWIQDRIPDKGRNTEPDRRPAVNEPLNVDEPAGSDVASPRIDKGYLDLVKDNTMGIRRDEAEVFYWLLDHARRVPSGKLERAGLREVQYINLMTEPDRFRGELVTIEGDLWRLYEFDAGQNQYGVNRLYEAWVFTGDSANHPYRIVCTSLPKGIEPGENLRKPVRVTGYFFKREGYRSSGGVHVAPTLLARRMAINPAPNGIPSMSGIVPTMTGAVMAIGLALLITMVGFAIGDERSRLGRELVPSQPRLSFSNLPLPAPISVEESLRLFAEKERLSAVSGAYGPLLSRQAAREHAVRDGQGFRQSERDAELRRQQRTSDVVVDWANRQKMNQAQIDEFEATRQGLGGPAVDELDTDSLAPAHTRVVRPAAPIKPVRESNRPASSIESRPFESLYGASVAPAINPVPAVMPTRQTESSNPSSSQVSYGASKLSEWEEEISRMNSRKAAKMAAALPVSTVKTVSVAEQIENDRLARERETQEQIRRQQAEIERRRVEHLNVERIEHDLLEQERFRHQQGLDEVDQFERSSFDRTDRQIDHSNMSSRSITATEQFASEEQERRRSEIQIREQERLIRERIERERIEREQLQRERMEHERNLSNFEQRYRNEDDDSLPDLDDDLLSDQESTDLPNAQDATPKSGKRRGGGWGWPRRRKTAEAADGAEQTPDELSEGGKGSASSGWGRSRKRRRRWSDDGTT